MLGEIREGSRKRVKLWTQEEKDREQRLEVERTVTQQQEGVDIQKPPNKRLRTQSATSTPTTMDQEKEVGQMCTASQTPPPPPNPPPPQHNITGTKALDLWLPRHQGEGENLRRRNSSNSQNQDR